MTIATLRVPLGMAAGQFGVAEVDADNRMVGFEEKPEHPKPIPGDAEHSLASMGIYVFTARFLFEQLCLDATRHGSHHDFGHNLIPSVINTHRVFAYPVHRREPQDRRPTGATWARWTPITTPTWT